MGMLLFRTWGYCAVKHGDVVPNVCFIKNAHISYCLLLKKLFIPSAFLYSSVSVCGRVLLSTFLSGRFPGLCHYLDISMNDF